MLDFSEKQIRKNCPHCNPRSFALKDLLKETKNFWVVCDVHPLCEGHILIVPKYHLSCVGAYDNELLKEFSQLYYDFSKFIKRCYGSISAFEHGKIGQTVFHAHTHLLPYKSKVENIIPEGKDKLTKLDSLLTLKDVFKRDDKYLFFSIGQKLWIVDLSLGEPRFFRDRFAKALGVPERGNWKKMHANKSIMNKANKEIKQLKKCWQNSKD